MHSTQPLLPHQLPWHKESCGPHLRTPEDPRRSWTHSSWGFIFLKSSHVTSMRVLSGSTLSRGLSRDSLSLSRDGMCYLQQNIIHSTIYQPIWVDRHLFSNIRGLRMSLIPFRSYFLNSSRGIPPCVHFLCVYTRKELHPQNDIKCHHSTSR